MSWPAELKVAVNLSAIQFRAGGHVIFRLVRGDQSGPSLGRLSGLTAWDRLGRHDGRIHDSL